MEKRREERSGMKRRKGWNDRSRVHDLSTVRDENGLRTYVAHAAINAPAPGHRRPHDPLPGVVRNPFY